MHRMIFSITDHYSSFAYEFDTHCHRSRQRSQPRSARVTNRRASELMVAFRDAAPDLLHVVASGRAPALSKVRCLPCFPRDDGLSAWPGQAHREIRLRKGSRIAVVAEQTVTSGPATVAGFAAFPARSRPPRGRNARPRASTRFP